MRGLNRTPVWLRAGVRRMCRAAGYEIRPLDASFEELLRVLLRSCDLLIDVGANTGQYVGLVRSLGFCGPVVSFEPEEAAFARLHAAARSDPEWTVSRFALADRQGEALLRVSANSVSSSLLDIRQEHLAAAPTSGTVAHQTVPLSTLDQQLTGVSGAALWLKLDVQGGEQAVLHGGRTTLERTVVVQTEVSLRRLYEGQTDYLELFAHLRDTGLTMCHVLPGFRDRRSGHLLQFDALFVRLTDPAVTMGGDVGLQASALAGSAGAG